MSNPAPACVDKLESARSRINLATRALYYSTPGTEHGRSRWRIVVDSFRQHHLNDCISDETEHIRSCYGAQRFATTHVRS